MCKNRSSKVISTIEKQFSYESLVSGIADERLPNYTRAILAQLTYVLFLDRYPHDEMLLPNVVRVYDEMNFRKDAVDDIGPYLEDLRESRAGFTAALHNRKESSAGDGDDDVGDAPSLLQDNR